MIVNYSHICTDWLTLNVSISYESQGNLSNYEWERNNISFWLNKPVTTECLWGLVNMTKILRQISLA